MSHRGLLISCILCAICCIITGVLLLASLVIGPAAHFSSLTALPQMEFHPDHARRSFRMLTGHLCLHL
eukprot:scaffold13975_cov10-Tisochrysis_lutea.AAC.1